MQTLTFLTIGAAVLVDDPIAHLSPTTTQLTKWSLDRKNSVRTQLAYVESKAAYEGTHVGRAISAEAIKKRKEREEKRRAARASKHAADAEEADVEDEDGIVYDSEPNVMVSSGSTVTPSKASKTKGALFTPQFPAILSKRYNLSSLPYVINIPASSSSLEWYSPKQASAIYTTLASAREARIWTYPSTLSERARCGVFKDLWKKGYFMGGGIKFGGEYLVYPGTYILFSIGTFIIDRFSDRLFRRPSEVSLSFHCNGHRLPNRFHTAHGNCCTWSSWHIYEKIAPPLQLERREARGILPHHRVGGVWLAIRMGVVYIKHHICMFFSHGRVK